MTAHNRPFWRRLAQAAAKPAASAAAAPNLTVPAGLVSAMRPLALEQRFMFDGAGAADAAHAVADGATATDAAVDTAGALRNALMAEAASATSPRQEVVFVDSQVANLAELLAGLSGNAEVVILDASKDGLQQMADYLQGRSGLDAIHLLSHGADGTVQMGNVWLSSANLGEHSAALQSIGTALKATGDLLLYGCNLAQGDQGQDFLGQLAAITGADVAASSDLTGSLQKGGNWTLEKSVGSDGIQADALVINDYNELLTIVVFDNTDLNSGSGIYNKTVSSVGFTFSGQDGYSFSNNYGTNYNVFPDSTGNPTGDATKLTIAVASGYTFDLTSFSYYTSLNDTITVTFTYASNTTVTGTLIATANANITLSNFSVFRDASNNALPTSANDIIKVVISSANGTGGFDFGTNNFDISDVRAIVASNATSTVTAGPSGEATTFSTTATSVASAVSLMDFTIADPGTSDGLATNVSAFYATVSGTATSAELAQMRFLLNGPDATNVVGTYDSSTGRITFSGLNLSIADGGSETYTIKAYYNDNTSSNDLTDHHTVVLSVNASNFASVSGGSTFASSQANVTNGSGASIDIAATKLIYSQSPSTSVVSGINFTTQPVVIAVDDRGNIDTDFNGSVTLSENGSGSLTGTTTVTASSGTATFSGVKYTSASDADANFVLTAAAGSLVSASSASINPDVVATRLVFSTQPGPTVIQNGQSTSFTTVPVVQAVDANGMVDQGYTTDIVLSVTDPNDGVVDGSVNNFTVTSGDQDASSTTVTLTPSGGIAIYSGLAILYTNSGNANTLALRATSGALTMIESSSIVSTVNQAPVISNLNGDSVAWAGAGNTVGMDVGGNALLSDTEFGALNGGNGNWAGASLTIQRNGTALASDVLGFSTIGALFTISGSNLQLNGLTFATFTSTGGVLTITFTSSGTAATTALVNDVAQRVTYRNDMPAGDTTLRYSLNDGTSTVAANVVVTSDIICVTNTNDTATIDLSNGVSLSEAVAIAAADATGSQTIVFASNLAGQTLNLNTVSLNESLTFEMTQANGLTLTGGTITLAGGTTQVFNVGFGNSATISNLVAGSGAMTKAGAGELTVSGSNTNTGTTTVSAGTLVVDGSTNSATNVASGATLAGRGTLGGSVTVQNGGTLSPGGAGVGTLTVNGNLILASGSALALNINGVTAGTGYDRVVVNGTVDISAATLAVSHGYAPASGDSYTVIVNDAADAVTGTFSGISEGGKINAAGNSTELTTSYIGGTGNDLTLNTPIAPTITNVSSSPTNGTYKIGDVITINVQFDSAVNVTGTPTLTLETGATDRVLSYMFGSGTNTLSFSYTVQAGDISLDLDYASTSALSLNGGSIRDGANQAAVLTLAAPGAAGSLGANQALVIDGVRPAATNITLSDTALRIGETATVTVTFNERVSGLDIADFSVTNGSLSNLSSSDGGLTWTATFTPSANISNATNLITLDNTGVMDQAGNIGSGSTDSVNYAIDTQRPTASIVVTDTALKAGQTTTVTITFSEAVTGLTTADFSVPNSTLSGLSSSDGGITWTATLTPDANVTDASNLINLNNTGVQDLAGNIGSGSTDSNNYVVDTIAPVTESMALDQTSLNAQQTAVLTVRFSEAVTGLDVADFTVVDGVLSGLSSADGGITWTATLTPAAGKVQAGIKVALNNAGYTDLAGNLGTNVSFSGSYAINTVLPAQPVLQVQSNAEGSATLRVDALEAGAPWEYSLDGGQSWHAGQGDVVAIGSPGLYNVQVRQTNAAGNVSQAGVLSVEVAPQAIPPRVEWPVMGLFSGASAGAGIWEAAVAPAGLAPLGFAADAVVVPGGRGNFFLGSGYAASVGSAFLGGGVATDAGELSSGFLGGASGVVGASAFAGVLAPPADRLVLLEPVDAVVASADRQVDWKVPPTMFGHSDPLASMQFAMTQADGRPLPVWLKFDARTGQISGTMPPGFQGELTLRLTARDSQGHAVSTVIKLKAGDAGPAARTGMAEQLQRHAQLRAGQLAAQRLHL